MVNLYQNGTSNSKNKKHKYIVLKPTISKPNIGHGASMLTILKRNLFGATFSIEFTVVLSNFVK